MKSWDRYEKSNHKRNIVITWAVLLFITFAGVFAWSSYNTTEVFTGEVTGKIVKRYNDEDKYLLFIALDDGTTRTIEMTDSVLVHRWTSSDDFGRIAVKGTYIFKTRGMRIPLFSEYPNVETYDFVKGDFD